jgi:DNA-binding IclR family transcriptional regulator
MILVIVKAFHALEALRLGGEQSLKSLAEKTGVKKPTLCVILKTLVELGYVKRTPGAGYVLGERFFALGAPLTRLRALGGIAEKHALALTEKLQEGVTVAMLEGDEYRKLIAVNGQQSITVNLDSPELQGNLYGSATGRVLLANADDATRERLLAHHGLPSDAWPGVKTKKALLRELDAIRDAGFCTKADGNGVAFHSAPIRGYDRQVWAAMGVAVPESRDVGSHAEDIVVSLRQAAERMSAELAETDWSALS